MHGFLSSTVNYSLHRFILCVFFAWFICKYEVHSQNSVNINRPYTNPPNSSINVQNISGAGAIKNYGSMIFNNLNMGTDTVYNYGNLTIINANNGVIVNMGVCSFQAANFNSSVVIINQSNGNLTFTAPNIYLNNYVCNAGVFQFNNLTINNQGSLYNCGSSVGTITNSNGTGFYTESNCGVCAYISPLPVMLSYFKAVELYNEYALVWETLSEVNADYFEVLKSKDFENWESVARVPAAGNSNQVLNYSLSIANERELYYYNLKQVDYNGTINDHGIISIKPEFNNFTLKNNSVQVIEPSSIRLYNTMGVMVKSAENCTDFSWDEMPGGIYIVTINGESLKVVKTN